MHDVKINKDCFVPKENIKFYVGYGMNAVKRDVCTKRKEGKVHDYTAGKKIASVIYLKNGELILVNTSITTLNQRMEGEKNE